MRGPRGVALLAAVALAAATLIALTSSGRAAAAASAVDWGDWNPAANGFPDDVGPVPAADEIHLYVGMTADTAGLDAFAAATNDPRSPSYGHRLPLAEARVRFGASDVTRAAVLGALAPSPK
jgi:hypothetical protein